MTSSKTTTPLTNPDLVGAKVKLLNGNVSFIKSANTNGYSLECGGPQIMARCLVKRARFLLEVARPAASDFILICGIAHIFTRKEHRMLDKGEQVDTSKTSDLSTLTYKAPEESEPKQPADKQPETEKRIALPAPLRRLISTGQLTLNGPQVTLFCEMLGLDYADLPTSMKQELKNLCVFTQSAIDDVYSKTQVPTASTNTSAPKHVGTKATHLARPVVDSLMQDVTFSAVRPVSQTRADRMSDVMSRITSKLGIDDSDLCRGLMLSVTQGRTTHLAAFLCIDATAINLVDVDDSTLYQLPIIRKSHVQKSIDALSIVNDLDLDSIAGE